MGGAAVSDDVERTGHLPEGEGPVSNEWVTSTRAGLAECVEMTKRMLETTARMAEDMRAIRTAVMGDER